MKKAVKSFLFRTAVTSAVMLGAYTYGCTYIVTVLRGQADINGLFLLMLSMGIGTWYSVGKIKKEQKKMCPSSAAPETKTHVRVI